jgi:uncharacterized membrane protein
VLGNVIKSLFPESPYWPGVGMFTGLAVAFIVGLLMRAYVVRQLFAKAENILYQMPLIKSVYGAIRDFFQYFSPTTKKEFEQVVAVTFENGMQVIGFVTQAIPEKLPEGFREEDSVLVYLPLSYMIGGYAVLVPRKMVHPIDMNMEEAMRFTLTAGVTGSNNSTPDKKTQTKNIYPNTIESPIKKDIQHNNGK